MWVNWSCLVSGWLTDGNLESPELTTLMEILTITPAQLNDCDLLPLPLSLSLPIGSLSLFIFTFSLFFFPLIFFKLRSVPAVCHNDTVSVSCLPSLLPLFQFLLTLSLSLCLSHFPRWVRGQRKNDIPSLFYKAFFPTLSLPVSVSCMLVQSSHRDSWSPFLLLCSFTLGYNVEIRLSLPFYFSVLLHCFGLFLCLSLLALCYFGRSAGFCITDP